MLDGFHMLAVLVWQTYSMFAVRVSFPVFLPSSCCLVLHFLFCSQLFNSSFCYLFFKIQSVFLNASNFTYRQWLWDQHWNVPLRTLVRRLGFIPKLRSNPRNQENQNGSQRENQKQPIVQKPATWAKAQRQDPGFRRSEAVHSQSQEEGNQNKRARAKPHFQLVFKGLKGNSSL